jgi:hypothetical protein
LLFTLKLFAKNKNRNKIENKLLTKAVINGAELRYEYKKNSPIIKKVRRLNVRILFIDERA